MEKDEIMQFFDGEKGKVKAYLLRKLPYEEVRDKLQDVLLKLLKYSERIKNKDRLPIILQKIAKGVVSQYFRDPDNHCNPQKPVLFPADLTHAATAENELVVNEVDWPDNQLEKKEMNFLIQIVLSSLESDQANLLRLKYLEGLSDQQISSCLRIPLGTVKTRLRRARIKSKEIALKYGLSEYL